MKETTEYIKNFNVGDKVTSTNSILLDRGFRGVTGTIRTLVKDDADSWQYLIDLDDGRELQCDDCHLVYPSLTDDQQVVLEYLKKMCPPELGVSAMVTVYCLVDDNINDNWQEYSDEIPEHIEALQKLSISEENQVLAAFAEWGNKSNE